MRKLEFTSKALNLANLRELGLQHSLVLPLCLIECSAINDPKTLEKIKSLEATTLIIRSSSNLEDNQNTSGAGAFLSIPNVPSDNRELLLDSMHKVAQSMGNSGEILIQPMLENITLCGVAFSVDKDNFAPYFCIQYDRSGSTHTITDGSAKSMESYFHYRLAPKPKEIHIKKILSMIEELEGIFDCNHLDIEFAFANYKGVEGLYCLQVRPLVMQNKDNLFNALPKESIERLNKRLQSLQNPHLHILGKRAIFGVMPDWNPAEIIGLRPKRLALSLYKEIITDSIWAYQRDNYGYRNLRSHPLMHSFLGMPFIDVRSSFNSFIPKDLDTHIATKLADYYLDTLAQNPQLHDKVEFAIIFSCYDFTTPKALKKLLNYGFNENETKRLEFSLLELTNSIIKPKRGLYLKDIKKVKKLKAAYLEINSTSMPLIDKIYWLLESCKRYGTLPFAGVARAGFIAMQMLNSLVSIGFFTPLERERFLNSLSTVSKKLSAAVANLQEESKQEFLEQYGHLRAGTYNILSPRYDKAFERYFSTQALNPQITEDAFSLESQKSLELEKLLKEHGLKINTKDFLKFLKTAIEGREYVKFEFSKLLSLAIELIAQLGEHYEISKEDMAFLDIKSILTLYSSLYSKSPKSRFLEEIARHKEEYKLTLALKLPSLILSPNDVFGFFANSIIPNFITQKSVLAPIALENTEDLAGKIVLIYAADPGYDYLFTKNIAGFITCYGGANSHMAIRASELGLPAVIGVGEEAFAKYTKASKIRIECQSEQIFCL